MNEEGFDMNVMLESLIPQTVFWLLDSTVNPAHYKMTQYLGASSEQYVERKCFIFIGEATKL